MTCLSCQSLRGEQELSPAAPVYEGVYWQVEHAYPTSLLGWLVIVLKRHCEALHELTTEEYRELTTIQERLVKVLRAELHCEKEYVMCFAEKEGFNHIHVHLVARPHDLSLADRGPKIFSRLGVDESETLSPREIKALCKRLKRRLDRTLI